MTNYVIIGNSMAANAAAARIHSLDAESPITLISDEPDLFYSRCGLMYYVMDHCWKRDLYIADREHYRRLNATLVHDKVTGVNAEAHELQLESGGTMAYDKLLIASGTTPYKLGAGNEDADGIQDFFTLADADKMLAAAQRARRAVVVGGGLIGAEAAEVLHTLKIPTDFLIREDYFFPILCSEAQGRIIERRFEHHGISMHLGRLVDHFEKDDAGHVRAVVDDAGDRYEADLVMRCIGVGPTIWFLEGSGVETDTGVLVDDRLKNKAPDVWAAGDCAEIQFPGRERATIQKLWYTAQPQGWAAGENMAGGDTKYELMTPYTSAMFMDLDFCSYGEMPAPWNDLQEQSVTAPNEIDCARLIHDGERVMGASFLGTGLTKQDIEHLVDSSLSVPEAVETLQRVLGGAILDRAPRARIAEQRRLSRRPVFWPFGDRKTWRRDCL
ncbi:MAG: NAD(P)/FAD-dependent oxidoreductase [Armatimonadota bacterium]